MLVFMFFPNFLSILHYYYYFSKKQNKNILFKCYFLILFYLTWVQDTGCLFLCFLFYVYVYFQCSMYSMLCNVILFYFLHYSIFISLCILSHFKINYKSNSYLVLVFFNCVPCLKFLLFCFHFVFIIFFYTEMIFDRC